MVARDTKRCRPAPRWRSIAAKIFSHPIIAISDLAVGIGLTPFEILLSLFARADDHNGGRQFPNHYSSKAAGLMSFSSIFAAHIPHAVGAAYAFKYRGETGRAVLATCGDGTTSEGEWHESMNFAGDPQAAVRDAGREQRLGDLDAVEQTDGAARNLETRRGYGMPGRRFNGLDPIETYAVVNEAMERARSGGGPSLIEGNVLPLLSALDRRQRHDLSHARRWSRSIASTIRFRVSKRC